MTGGQFSKEQIESFPCSSAGNPAKAVDMSCNTATLRQNYAPDNGIAIAVDPVNSQHLVAGSNYYLSHGTGDRLLPIERCSRRIVPRLEREDYEVRYREFDGPHTVPGSIAHEALDWFTSG